MSEVSLYSKFVADVFETFTQPFGIGYYHVYVFIIAVVFVVSFLVLAVVVAIVLMSVFDLGPLECSVG